MEILWTEDRFPAKLFLLSLASNFCIRTTFLCHVVRSRALGSDHCISNESFGCSWIVLVLR